MVYTSLRVNIQDSFLFSIALIILCLFKTVRVIDVDYLLRLHGIIPDVIDEAPEFIMNVSYRSGELIQSGYKIDPAAMQRMPRVEWPTESGVLYTLLMIDPDVPVRKNPSMAQRQHWIVGNIPGHDVRLGETITGYVGPITPKNSGLHRNTFLVYSQNSRINFIEPRIPPQDRRYNQRYKFSSRKFAEKYNLTLYAVNYCRSGWPLYSVSTNKEPNKRPHNTFRERFAPPPKPLEV